MCSWRTSRVGDCFNDTGFSGTESGAITRVACDAPHDGEVFAVADLPLGPEAPYPGDDDVRVRADGLCLPKFASYVGIEVEKSKWDFGWYSPSEETWVQDDRHVMCALTNPDLNSSKVRSGTARHEWPVLGVSTGDERNT